MELNKYINAIPRKKCYLGGPELDGMICTSISIIDFLLEAVLDDDVYKIENEGVGWVFVDLLASNLATEEKPFDVELIDFSYSEYNNLNKQKIIELLLRLSLSLNQDQSYNNSNIFFAINVLFAVCDFYGLKLNECIDADLNGDA